MKDILTDPAQARLAEAHNVVKRLAAAQGESVSEIERQADAQFMQTCVAYFTERRRNEGVALRYIPNRSPAWNIHELLDIANDLDLYEVTARTLVGATLELAFSTSLETHPTPATAFTINTTRFHVTASPGSTILSKCREEFSLGLHPVLLVPHPQLAKTRHLAEDKGMTDDISIVGIEDYIATSIIALSSGRQSEFVTTLHKIISAYNRRLEEVETDMSLKIEIN